MQLTEHPLEDPDSPMEDPLPIEPEPVTHYLPDSPCYNPTCQELTTLWVARLDNGAELKVTDPKEQQGDVEKEETKGKERRDEVD